MAHWAILGSGVNSDAVAAAIAAHPKADLHAVADDNAGAADALAARHGIATVHHDYDAALADPQVEIVYIGLPNHAHLPMVRKAAAAGKAILCEASLSVTTDDAEDLIEAVEDAGVFFVEGLAYLAHPLQARLRDVLRDARLGRIRAIRASYAADLGKAVDPARGGTLYTAGFYPASLVHFIVQSAFGEDAFADRRMTAEGQVDADGNVGRTSAEVHFGTGTRVTLRSGDAPDAVWSCEIEGEAGTLSFRTNPWLPGAGETVLELDPHDGAAERIVVPGGQDAFAHQIAMIEAHVARGDVQADRPSPRWVDSLEIMDFLNQWEVSARR